MEKFGNQGLGRSISYFEDRIGIKLFIFTISIFLFIFTWLKFKLTRYKSEALLHTIQICQEGEKCYLSQNDSQKSATICTNNLRTLFLLFGIGYSTEHMSGNMSSLLWTCSGKAVLYVSA